MIVDSLEDCLALWFGKSASTDRRIWDEFSKDVIKALLPLSLSLLLLWVLVYTVTYSHFYLPVSVAKASVGLYNHWSLEGYTRPWHTFSLLPHAPAHTLTLLLQWRILT